MEDLGELGFWLAAGIVVAALIVSGGLKEREKERQKQETLRALLTAEDKSTTEILAYMRERDAADLKREHDIWVANGGNLNGRAVAAFLAKLVGFLGFIAGIFVLAAVWRETGSLFNGVSAMLVVTAGGALFGGAIYLLFRGKKKAPPPGA